MTLLIKIPFSLLPSRMLYSFSRHFLGVAQRIEKSYPTIEVYLTQAEAKIKAIDYIAMSLVSLTTFALIIFSLSMLTLLFNAPFFLPVILTAVFSSFVFL